MSGLISSYFIEPVVRQARRFGNNPSPNPAIKDITIEGTGPSHAAVCGQDMADLQPRTDVETQDQKSSLFSHRQLPITSLGQAIYHRFAPLLATNRSTDDTAQLPNQPTRPTSSSSPSVLTGTLGPEFSRSSTHQDTMPTTPYSRPLQMRLPSRDRTIQALRILSDHNAGHSASLLRGDTQKLSEPLPEDDGHEQLRQRIIHIWEHGGSNEDKAKLMHAIMNESYHASRTHYVRPTSPESVNSQGRPLSSNSSASINGISGDDSSSAQTTLESSNPYNIQPHDLIPSFRPDSSPGTPDHSVPFDALDEPTPVEPDFGCAHYKRNVKVQCFACKTWWPCRLCHDEAELGHELPRHLTENMLCMFCKTPGPAGQSCKHCSAQAAHYYCEVCQLWDDSNRSVYHCSGCGICRLGEGIGKDYEHCKVSKIR
jgi:hypothetical protein